MTEWTWAKVEAAAAATAGWKRTRRGEWRGPCRCGGEVNRAWVRRGRRANVLAGCNAGCSGPDVIAWLTGDELARPGRAFPPRRNEWPRPRPLGRPKAPRPLGGDSGRFRANPTPTTKTEAAGSPRSDERDATRPPVPPDSDLIRRIRAARHLWKRARPVPIEAGHPARRWAARRHLWRPGDPWPDAVRWLEDDGGSLVAAFAPLADWLEAHPPEPSGVQRLHVAADGSPRTDRDGRGKVSRGSMSGAVCLIGVPLETAPVVHVAEGVADALAVAAREDGAALAVGGTAGFGRLAPALAALAVPVVAWPDGDEPGRIAAGGLVARLRGRGTVARLATVPDGSDPAAMVAPFNVLQKGTQ